MSTTESQATPGSQMAEWRAHWPIVLVAFFGYSFPAVVVNSIGLFIEPLYNEFGWSRTQITAGLTISGFLAIPLSPFVGALIDRWGVRRIALPGAILTTLAIASLGLANGSTFQWLALWTIYGLVVMGVKATIWAAAVSNVFMAGRSMALAIALGGTSTTAIVAPPLAQWLTDTYGWREAYMGLGLVFGVPILILSFFFLHSTHERQRAAGGSGINANAALPGLSVKEAARSIPLMRIGLSTFIMLTMGASLIVHKVPILTEAGVTREYAALMASLAGVATIVGKLATGWLMQRFDAGWVAGITNSISALALVLLLDPFRTPLTIVISMMCLGYAGGTKLQIGAFLTGVYGGLKNFGKIFGVMTSIAALSSGLGPALGGIVYDLSGGYDMLVMIGIPANLIAGALLVKLGPFPEWSRGMLPRRFASGG